MGRRVVTDGYETDASSRPTVPGSQTVFAIAVIPDYSHLRSRVFLLYQTERLGETAKGSLIASRQCRQDSGLYGAYQAITEVAIGYRLGDRVNRVTIPSQVGHSLFRWHYGNRAQSQNHAQGNRQVFIVKPVNTVTQIYQQRLAEKASDKSLDEYHESPQSRFGQMTMDNVASRQRPYKPAQQIEGCQRTGRAVVSLSIRQLTQSLQPPAISREIFEQRLLLGRASRPRPPTDYHQD